MTHDEQVRYDALLKLMKHYRSELEKAKRKNRMDISRAKEILSYPSSELVNMCLSLVNLTEMEEQAINYCYRLGYTQERAAEKMLKSRNAVYSYCRTGLDKIVKVWNGVDWIKNL